MFMDIVDFVLEKAKAKSIIKRESIQSLWSGTAGAKPCPVSEGETWEGSSPAAGSLH